MTDAIGLNLKKAVNPAETKGASGTQGSKNTQAAKKAGAANKTGFNTKPTKINGGANSAQSIGNQLNGSANVAGSKSAGAAQVDTPNGAQGAKLSGNIHANGGNNDNAIKEAEKRGYEKGKKGEALNLTA